jgi:uncharacterized protein
VFDTLLSNPVLISEIIAALMVAGFIAGVLAGMLGVGGGIVIVPVLYFVFQLFNVSPDIAMFVAVGTSLLTIVATSLSSVRSHHKRGAVDWDLLKAWAPGIIIGDIAGTYVASLLNGHVLVVMFAILAFLISLRMFFSSNTSYIKDGLPGQPLEFIYSFFIGSLSVMVGIGGGSITVPILSAYNFPIRKAVACSSGIGLIIALPGAIGFMITGYGVEGTPPGSIGYVNLLAFALVVPMTVLCAPLGAKIAHSVNPLYLKRGFALFLLITSLKMLSKAL